LFHTPLHHDAIEPRIINNLATRHLKAERSPRLAAYGEYRLASDARLYRRGSRLGLYG
jgi:hypothetical protein